MKLYHATVTHERFGYDCRESLRLLQGLGFQLRLMVGREVHPLFQPKDADRHLGNDSYSLTLVASKRIDA